MALVSLLYEFEVCELPPPSCQMAKHNVSSCYVCMSVVRLLLAQNADKNERVLIGFWRNVGSMGESVSWRRTDRTVTSARLLRKSIRASSMGTVWNPVLDGYNCPVISKADSYNSQMKLLNMNLIASLSAIKQIPSQEPYRLFLRNLLKKSSKKFHISFS